jgi:hypothetical protein
MSNRFHVAAEDLASMVEIARVSSYAADKKAWTELALYYRDDPARPWVPVVEGRTDALDMSNRFSATMMGTVERAMNWFEGSNLRDRLSEKVQAAFGDCNPHDWARDRLQVQGWQREAAARDPHHADGIGRHGGRIPLMEPGETIAARAIGDTVYLDTIKGLNVEGIQIPVFPPPMPLPKLRVVGITTDSLYEVLRWLYPDSASDSARSTLLERDFGMPARTTRRALAVECGDAAGELGAWVNMFIVTMRFFDRELWIAGQATIANVES